MEAVLQSLPGFFQIINVVVLLSALFFFTSTVASHLVEAFVGFINSRGNQLYSHLVVALGEKATKAIYDDPLIKSLATGTDEKKHPPSYIEPEFFARVVAKLFGDASSEVSKSDVLKGIKEKLAAAPGEFEPKIIEWFKAVNDRQNGVYTRWTFLRLIAVGFLFAAAMDIDTVHIAATMWSNPEQAKKAADKLGDAATLSSKNLNDLSNEERKKLQDSVANAVKELRSIDPPAYAWQSAPKDFQAWIAKLLGWILTALATSLGAQFWFNIMSEALKLRAAGRKPEAEPKKK